MSDPEVVNDTGIDFELPTDSVFGNEKPSTLHLDIPLETRVTFVDKDDLTIEWLNAGAIAKAVNKYDRWVYRRLSELGIPSEIKIKDGVEIPTYPPFTIAVLKEELAWRESFTSLPSHLPFTRLAELTGRSHGWTRKTMDEVGARPTRSTDDNGRVIDLYPKGVLQTLRRINMAVPMDDGWLPMNQITLLVNADWEWVAKRLAEGGYEAQRRRSSLTGKIGYHFSPDSLKFLEGVQTERPQYGGEWMSSNAMSELLGRNYKWIERRVRPYREDAELRQDDNGVSRVHYPLAVVEKLREESDKQRATPEVGDYISFKILCRAAGHTAATTSVILEGLGISPEPRKDGRGKIGEYFHPSLVSRIKEYDRGQERPYQEKLLEATFAVGSIKARLQAIKGQLGTLRLYGESASKGQIDALNEQMSIAKAELKKASPRYYRLINNA